MTTRLFFEQEHQHRDEQSGEAEQVERPAPTYVLSDPTTKKECETRANCYTRGIDCLHRSAAAWREVIAEQRECRRSQSRLADADHHATKEERPETAGESREAGEKTPDRQAAGDHVFSHGAIRQSPKRNSEDSVEDYERRGAQQRKLQIGKRHLFLDWSEEDVDECAIEKVEDVNQGEQGQRIPCISAGPLF